MMQNIDYYYAVSYIGSALMIMAIAWVAYLASKTFKNNKKG